MLTCVHTTARVLPEAREKTVTHEKKPVKQNKNMKNDTPKTDTKLITEHRRAIIAGLVGDQGAVSSEELSSRFGVTHMTVYRDLKALEALGRLRAVRGGAVRSTPNPAGEPLYFAKRQVNQSLKENIARYAANHFVHDGENLILEAGTTVVAMVKHLRQANLTLVTNGLETVNETTSLLPALTVMSCGGILREVSHTFVGPQAEDFFRGIRARTLFLGATGLTSQGITDPNPLEIQVKRAMAASAERVVLLLDSSKFGLRSLAPLLTLGQIHAVVTDNGATNADLEMLRTAGLEVHIAD
jgi:DeoR/GlpR family transcriptional regulator of sugar metabolism